MTGKYVPQTNLPNDYSENYWIFAIKLNHRANE